MSESAADKIRDLVSELEETIEKWEDRGANLERKCGEQTRLIHDLADELGKSRAEVHELKKQLKEATELLSQLPRQKRRNSAHVDQRVICSFGDTGKEPLDVFPEEVWSMIFGLLKEPQDLKSCYQSCTKFIWILQDKRKYFLFLDVLKVLQDHVQGFGLAESDGQWNRSLSELPKCRLVCHGWKQSVDKFLQEDCPIFPKNVQVSNDATSQTALRFTHNKNPWGDAALRELSPDINPMMSRFLMWYDDEDHRYQMWRSYRKNVIMEFLRKFGHHVWFLKLTLQNSMCEHWYISLLAWLEKMPNLKALSIFICDDTSAEVVSQNTFPTIPTMKTVVLVGCSLSITKSILTANPHVERLVVRRDGKYYYNIGSFKLEQLKEMSYDDIRCRELRNGNWNLSKLTLEYKSCWKKLFQTLEKEFAGSLVEMNLRLSGPDPECGTLNLPKLRILSLKITDCFNSIDFILPLVNLEHLKVDVTGLSSNYEYSDSSSDIVETIEFHQYTHCLKDSNIWRLFPKLKKVLARTDRDEPGPYHEIVDSEWQHCSRNEVDI